MRSESLNKSQKKYEDRLRSIDEIAYKARKAEYMRKHRAKKAYLLNMSPEEKEIEKVKNERIKQIKQEIIDLQMRIKELKIEKAGLVTQLF
tara:strand:- start:4020 stop:4292 length:273 start_codon:yes stop_codon:yes gene_type:complete